CGFARCKCVTFGCCVAGCGTVRMRPGSRAGAEHNCALRRGRRLRARCFVTAQAGGAPLRILDRLEEWVIAFLMGAATLLIFVAVVHRYAAGMPIPGVQDALLTIDLSWAQELCIYMFVWMAKFGAAYGVRTGIHVGVDVMINRLPPGTRRLYVVFGLLAGATFTGIVGTLGATFTWDIAHTDSVSPDLELPKWIVY